MAKECLVIPTDILIQEGILPPKQGSEALYIPLSTVGGIENIYRLAAEYGEYREREGQFGVEKNPAFQQLIMYAFVVRKGTFLAYHRGSTTDGNYDESRLEGKVALGLGGHIEPSDLSLEYSLFREIDEEAQILENNQVIDFKNGTTHFKAWFMRNYLNLTPVGLIKDQRDEVGRVHLGIACKLTLKSKGVGIRVRINKKEENVKYQYLTPRHYQHLVETQQITPEGWSDIVFRNEILGTRKNNR